MCLMATWPGLGEIRTLIASALQLILYQQKVTSAGRRRVIQVVELAGWSTTATSCIRCSVTTRKRPHRADWHQAELDIKGYSCCCEPRKNAGLATTYQFHPTKSAQPAAKHWRRSGSLAIPSAPAGSAEAADRWHKDHTRGHKSASDCHRSGARGQRLAGEAQAAGGAIDRCCTAGA